jgi:hypothetical protein
MKDGQRMSEKIKGKWDRKKDERKECEFSVVYSCLSALIL